LLPTVSLGGAKNKNLKKKSKHALEDDFIERKKRERRQRWIPSPIHADEGMICDKCGVHLDEGERGEARWKRWKKKCIKRTHRLQSKGALGARRKRTIQRPFRAGRDKKGTAREGSGDD
jgi:hypothetical protein